jgi:hypothetical protein
VIPLQVERFERWFLLRDDRLTGGTKRRVIGALFDAAATEYVYASPAYGYAQIALAHAARDHGVQATIFVARRATLHPRTAEARAAGARVVQVPYGYLTNVQAKARAYCVATGARLLPWGLDAQPVVERIAEAAGSLGGAYPEVWCCAGSGVLTRGLQLAWPQARHVAVRIGAAPKAGAATILAAPERFEQRAKQPPPFPSCDNYDAKVWRFFREQAAPGALYWNVAA